MANHYSINPVLPVFCLLLFFSFHFGEGVAIDAEAVTKTKNSATVDMVQEKEMKTWCVAKPSSTEAELASNIQFACDNIGAGGAAQSCKIIQEGGPCFSPDTPVNHASVVMNLYYQFAGRNFWNCDFAGSALITIADPSYGGCQYAAA